MIESIKTQLWQLLKKKDVSLVMIYDKEGKILWQKGRNVKGKSVHEGEGFSKTFINESFNRHAAVVEKNVAVNVFGDHLSASARHLHIKSLFTLPVTDSLFLYIDSGVREYFSETEIEVFKTLGFLLGKNIERMLENEREIGGISGASNQMKLVREMVVKFSMETEPVLLIGETGVGKSHTAELIHRYSGRKGRFEVAEITTINENLFESTMFGYKKGAFTDAKTDRSGLVQEAEGGTLFIDEVAEIPVSFQGKLLRFIETQKYRVLGEPYERKADVRIVAATNKDLQQAIETGEFREDLYYRLHVLEIRIPPLRERKEDIRSFVTENKRYLKGKELAEDCWEVINEHHWSGNMRELITVLKRAGILLDSPVTGEGLKNIIGGGPVKKIPEGAEPPSNGAPAADPRIREAWTRMKAGESFWDAVKEPFLDRDLNRDQVKHIIEEGLNMTNGKHVSLMELFNIDKTRYKKFMKFLYRNELR